MKSALPSETGTYNLPVLCYFSAIKTLLFQYVGLQVFSTIYSAQILTEHQGLLQSDSLPW